MKKFLRKLSLKLYDYTSSKVVPHFVWVMIDHGFFHDAEASLEDAERKWGNDPAIIHARSLIQFMKNP